MNIRYISNIFRGENLWDFWCVCPVYASVHAYARDNMRVWSPSESLKCMRNI